MVKNIIRLKFNPNFTEKPNRPFIKQICLSFRKFKGPGETHSTVIGLKTYYALSEKRAVSIDIKSFQKTSYYKKCIPKS